MLRQFLLLHHHAAAGIATAFCATTNSTITILQLTTNAATTTTTTITALADAAVAPAAAAAVATPIADTTIIATTTSTTMATARFRTTAPIATNTICGPSSTRNSEGFHTIDSQCSSASSATHAAWPRRQTWQVSAAISCLPSPGRWARSVHPQVIKYIEVVAVVDTVCIDAVTNWC